MAPKAIASAVVAALIAFAGAASANPRYEREAERRNQRGNALYGAGRYEAALHLYQSAHDLSPRPKYLFNIGLAKEKVFDYEGCALAFRQFLRESEEDQEEARGLAAAALQRCRERVAIPVRVTSSPTNAAIFTGEGEARTLRGRSPYQLDLAPGSHVMSIELDGHVSQSREVAVEVGERPQIDFVLDKLSSIRIDVDAPGAEVKVDDSEWIRAPLVREVEAGVYRVQVRREGYEPADREVKVASGQELALVLSLRPIPRLRELSVRVAGAAPEATSVEIDGEGVGPPPVRQQISAGTHRIEVTARGRLPYAADITIPADRDLRLLVSLEPLRTERQRLTLWGLFAASAGAAAVGGTYGALALRDQARFRDSPSVPLHARGEARARNADVWFAVSAVMGGAGLIYYYLTEPGQSKARLE